MKEKEYHKAIQLFEEAIKLNPNRDEAYSNLANTYDDLKEYEKALEIYDNAIKINPANPSYYFNLGIIYRNLSYKKLKDLLDFKKPYYSGQVADNKDNENINFLKAAYLEDSESITVLRSNGIIVNDNKSIIDKLIEIAYKKKIKDEDYKSAIDIFRFILNNNNNHSTALFGISFCYYTLGIEDEEKWEYENAILYYNQAIDYCLQLLNIEQNNKNANNILGLSYYASAGIYINVNNLSKAIEYLNKAKGLVKEKKDIVLKLLAQAYYYNEQNDKAEETIRELSIITGKIDLTILEESKETKYFKFLIKANSYDFKNNWEKAFEYYDKAIELIPTKQDAYHQKAKCYEHKKEFNEALKYLEKAISIDPKGDADQIKKDIENIKNKIRNNDENKDSSEKPEILF